MAGLNPKVKTDPEPLRLVVPRSAGAGLNQTRTRGTTDC